MNTPNNQECRAMRARYSPPKAPIKVWQVISCGKVVFENESPGICEWWIKNSGIKAVKQAVR